MADPVLLFARPYDPSRWKRFLVATSLCVLTGSALIAFIRMHVQLIGQAKPNPLVALIGTPLSLLMLMAVGIGLSFGLALLLQKPLKTNVPLIQTWTVVTEIALVKLGFSTLVLGLIVILRGAHAFSSPQDIVRSMPSLAMLFPHAGGRLAALLGVVDPFNVWVCALYAIGFRFAFHARTTYSVWAGFAIGLLPQFVVRFLAP